MCHSVTLVRGLDGSLDRPRSSYAFARLIRESQSIGKCWNTHWNCAAINNLLKQKERFFMLSSGYFPASLFSIFDSSKLFESGFQVSTDESSNPASQHLSFNHLWANAMGSSHRMVQMLCFAMFFLSFENKQMAYVSWYIEFCHAMSLNFPVVSVWFRQCADLAYVAPSQRCSSSVPYLCKVPPKMTPDVEQNKNNITNMRCNVTECHKRIVCTGM